MIILTSLRKEIIYFSLIIQKYIFLIVSYTLSQNRNKK